MNIADIIAIACVATAIVILLSLAMFTYFKAWKAISREYAQGGQRQEGNDNEQCVEGELPRCAGRVDDKKNKEHAQTQPVNSNTNDRVDHEFAAANELEVVVYDVSNDTSL